MAEYGAARNATTRRSAALEYFSVLRGDVDVSEKVSQSDKPAVDVTTELTVKSDGTMPWTPLIEEEARSQFKAGSGHTKYMTEAEFTITLRKVGAVLLGVVGTCGD